MFECDKLKLQSVWQSLNKHRISFLAPKGAQGEAMSCVRPCMCHFPQKNIEKEF